MADFKIARIRYTWKGVWNPTIAYIKDDIVSYGGKVYVCFVTHTSSTVFLPDLTATTPKWVLMFDGYTWRSTWNTGTLYNPGDVVRYSGTVYRCITSHTSNAATQNQLLTVPVPGLDIVTGLEADQSKWEIVARTHTWENVWTVATRYQVADIVKYGATVYKCNTAHNSAASATEGLEVDLAKWDIVFQQSEYKSGGWTTATRYKVGDITKWGGTQWKCTVQHTSSSFAVDLANWSVYLDGLQFEPNAWVVGGLYQEGDVVTYGGYSYRAIVNNQGQLPSTPASTFWSNVTENYNFRGDWAAYINAAAIFYKVGDVVRLNGYLYVATADNQLQEPPNASYWQVLTQAEAWRGSWIQTTVLSPVKYKLGDYVTYGSSTYECVLAHIPDSVPKRPDQDIAGSGTYWKALALGIATNVMVAQGDTIWYNSGTKERLPIGTEGQVLKVSGTNIIWTTLGAVFPKVFYVATYGQDDALNGWGKTLDRPFRTVRYACSQATSAATIFIKTGIYSEILPIIVPANVALVGDELRGTIIQAASGYTTSDMFYVRDGSGIRNMTLQGLTGTLGAFNIYLTKRPTAGAYVSLDPQGAADPLAQIINRSPYVQNVTAIGTGCVGLKVDGAIHGAGNKSIVANDFTMVISDGIGAWITNKARSELVSVFTYYCHIGYLTEGGGQIRATNGNCSYGDYGAVSEGTSSDEVPKTGTVNNVAGTATIGNVFCDGQNILTFEYDNAGKAYDTSTTFNITGTGLGAVVASTPVRNGGVMEIRLVDPGTTLSAGGSGYLQIQNNAQSGSGSAGTLYLAQADSNTASNYVSLRVVIISGKGAGQYGYIQAYNATSKLATIYKETTQLSGWDHIVPGTTIVDLDTTSQYSIEPRISFSAPGSGILPQARAVVVSGRISKFRIWEPGSGYVVAPTMTVIDPNRGDPVSFQVRIGDGVLTQPVWTSRGTGFLTTVASVATGVGYQDAFQTGKYLYVTNLSSIPGPGANISITGNATNYRLTAADQITGSGPYSARFALNPSIELSVSPNQGTSVAARVNYSQNRLTGHDFLEVGTGNFSVTNYPNQDTTTIKAGQLAVENGGGRVFYTATDQDGNFRVGSLFKVEQASGIATLNASFFDLGGLTQLSLGGIVLGGTSATITEISTDATMPSNSDAVIVTQRAIKAYIAARIGGGGANLNVNAITAGQVSFTNNTTQPGNQVNQNITNTGGTAINFKSKINFTGGVDGSMLSTAYFIASMR
jgi:hypothetical protein